MDRFESDKPWKKTISFEATYVSGYFVSFLIRESLSYYGKDGNDPAVYSRCFHVQEGNPVNAAYFTDTPDNPEIARGFIVELLKEKALADFYADGNQISEEYLANFDKAVTLESFYLTENGMTFFVGRGEIDPYELSGLYKAEFTWDELSGLFNKPEIY